MPALGFGFWEGPWQKHVMNSALFCSSQPELSAQAPQGSVAGFA